MASEIRKFELRKEEITKIILQDIVGTMYEITPVTCDNIIYNLESCEVILMKGGKQVSILGDIILFSLERGQSSFFLFFFLPVCPHILLRDKLCSLYMVTPEYILYGEGEAPTRTYFKKDNKEISLDTIQKMNKIMRNLHEMHALAEKHNIK